MAQQETLSSEFAAIRKEVEAIKSELLKLKNQKPAAPIGQKQAVVPQKTTTAPVSQKQAAVPQKTTTAPAQKQAAVPGSRGRYGTMTRGDAGGLISRWENMGKK